MLDQYGLEVSTNSNRAIEVIDHFGKNLLAMGKNVVDILDQAKNHQGSTLINSLAACLLLYGQTKETDAQAKQYLECARRALSDANDREKLFLSGMESWSQGEIEEATKKLEQLIKEWPRDLTTAKVLEFFYYLKGQHYSGPRFLQAMEGIYEENKHSGYFLSSLSFAAELCGQYDRAQEMATKALTIEKVNPWAHHTLCHVLLKKGEIEGGIRLLEEYEKEWGKSGQAICSHNHWHLALMYLENLDHEKALSFVDGQILREKPYLVIQHLDAISLLWRIEMAGYEVPVERWKALSEIITENADDCYTAYNSAHYIYALARAQKNEEFTKALTAIESASSVQPGREKKVWEQTGLPLLRACTYFAAEDYVTSAETLEPVMAAIESVGGSDAQVDLFRQMYLLSLIESGAQKKARLYLNNMVHSETLTPLEEYWESSIACKE